MSGPVTSCRMCDATDLAPFLDLGSQPPADSFLKDADETEERFPLRICSCQSCGLAQLDYVVSPSILYCNDYPYDASTAATACRHWAAFADSFLDVKDKFVVDIGSNVGVLLQAFKNNGAKVLGVDPAINIAIIANQNKIETYPSFFEKELAKLIVNTKGQADIITGTNVFAHVDNITEFMEAIDILLKPDGSFVFELPYFVNLIQKLQYDTIYHEHLSYVSVRPLIKFFAKFDMAIYAIEEHNFHGGAIRVFVRKSKDQIDSVVMPFLEKEDDAGIYKMNELYKFEQKVMANRNNMQDLIFKIKAAGEKIAIVSTPAKGMTLLNYCGLNNRLIEFATEKAKLKIGKFTPGTHIPILPDSALIEQAPDYALLLAWNFAPEIIKNNPHYRGKYIVPIPTPRIVN